MERKVSLWKFEIKGHGEPNLGLLSNFSFPNLGERFGSNLYLPKFYLLMFLLFIFHPYGSGFIHSLDVKYFIQHFSFVPFSFLFLIFHPSGQFSSIILMRNSPIHKLWMFVSSSYNIGLR